MSVSGLNFHPYPDESERRTTVVRPLAPGLLALLLLVPPSFTSAADDPTHVDPAAKALLDEVAAAYRALPAYADRGVFTVELTVDGQRQSHAWPMAVTLRRPDRIRLEAGDAWMVCDGDRLATVIGPTRSYLVEPAPERITPATVSEGPLGALLLGGPGGVPSSIVLNLLLADDPVAAILAGGVGLRLAPDAEVDGAAVRSLVLDPGVGPDYLLRINPTTKLLHRIELVADPATLQADTPAGATLADAVLAWTAGAITTEAPDDAVFAFEPPVGYTEVTELQEADPPAEPGPERGRESRPMDEDR